jgi:phage shock protein A
MGITSRILKIFKADIHGVMDQLEDQGLLLKQYLRDMEEALNQKEAKLAKKLALRSQTQKELDKYDQHYRALDHDLTVAVEKDKDDIARMLIRKTKPLSSLCTELVGQIATLDEEISRFTEYLEQQRIQYEQLKIRSTEYFHRTEMQQRENDILDIIPNSAPGELSEHEIELELLKRKEAIGSN